MYILTNIDEFGDEYKLLQGRFAEGEKVVISINGCQLKRRVYWDSKAKDLYVVIGYCKYFYSSMFGDC